MAESAAEPGWRAALAYCRRREHLCRTLRSALVVGIVLTSINQLDVILGGDATTVTWLKCGMKHRLEPRAAQRTRLVGLGDGFHFSIRALGTKAASANQNCSSWRSGRSRSPRRRPEIARPVMSQTERVWRSRKRPAAAGSNSSARPPKRRSKAAAVPTSRESVIADASSADTTPLL